MQLFVANLTNQHHDFLFRVPGDPRLHRQEIRSWKQAQVWASDAERETLEAIVEQHFRYGIAAANDRTAIKKGAGLVYSFGSPVDLDTLREGIAANEAALTGLQAEVERVSAAASFNAVKAAERGSERQLRALNIEVVEERKKPTDPPGVERTVSVSVDGKPSLAMRKRKMN